MRLYNSETHHPPCWCSTWLMEVPDGVMGQLREWEDVNWPEEYRDEGDGGDSQRPIHWFYNIRSTTRKHWLNRRHPFWSGLCDWPMKEVIGLCADANSQGNYISSPSLKVHKNKIIKWSPRPNMGFFSPEQRFIGPMTETSSLGVSVLSYWKCHSGKGEIHLTAGDMTVTHWCEDTFLCPFRKTLKVQMVENHTKTGHVSLLSFQTFFVLLFPPQNYIFVNGDPFTCVGFVSIQ